MSEILTFPLVTCPDMLYIDHINNGKQGVAEMFTFLPFFRKPAPKADITDRRWAMVTLDRKEKIIRDSFVATVDRTSFTFSR